MQTPNSGASDNSFGSTGSQFGTSSGNDAPDAMANGARPGGPGQFGGPNYGSGPYGSAPGQPIYGSSFGGPAKPSGMPTWGKILTGVGAVLVVIAIAVGVFGGIKTADLATTFSDAQQYRSSQTTSIPLKAGDERSVWSVDSGPGTRCTINGKQISVGGGQTFSNSNTEYRKMGDYKAEKDETISVYCTTPYVVTDLSSIGGFIGGIFGLVIGVFLGIGGVLVLAVGIVLWIVGANKNAKLRREGRIA